MGLGRLLGGLCAGAVAIVAAPVVLPGAIVSASCAVGGAAISAATAVGASAATTAAIGTAVTTGAAYATVGGIGAAAAKTASTIVGNEIDSEKDAAYSRGVKSGAAGREEEIQGYKNMDAAKTKIIEENEKTIEEQNKYINAQDEFIDQLGSDK